MLFVPSLFVRAFGAVIVRLGGSEGTKDLEILVLQHQVRVLRRKAGTARLTPLDRMLLASASRSLPRGARGSFMVSPSTLLRWHRELVRRKWTYGHRPRMGRPSLDPEVQRLILRIRGHADRPDQHGERREPPTNLCSRNASHLV